MVAAQLGEETPQQRLETTGAAAAAHARDYFPLHPDICIASQLLGLWTSLVQILPGKVMRTSGSSSNSRRARSSSGVSSSSGLQDTVLPACNMAVNLLKTWPPNLAGSSTTSSSTSSVPEDYMARAAITTLIYTLSEQLLLAVYMDVLADDSPCSSSDAKFLQELSASAAVQHLLLISLARDCHRRHQELNGLSPIKAKTAAAAVTASSSVAAAVAAVEADQQQQEDARRYLAVPAHHAAVLETLLVPAIDFDPMEEGCNAAKQLQLALQVVLEFILGMHTQGSTTNRKGKAVRLGRVTDLPTVPVKLCAPLHCLVAEAAALVPDALPAIHTSLSFMMSLQDVYFQVRERAGEWHSLSHSLLNVGVKLCVS